MGFINWIREKVNMILNREAKEVFGIDIASTPIDSAIAKWYAITNGNPEWVDEDDQIRTRKLANYIDSVTSGLVTLDIGINLPEGQRSEHLQKVVNYLLERIDNNVMTAIGNAGIMFKPNGDTIDYYLPGMFIPTAYDSNKNINGCMFVDRKFVKDIVYTKFEWHRYEGSGEARRYIVSNKCYMSKSRQSKGDECSLEMVDEWSGIEPEVVFPAIDKPLFAYFGNCKTNTVDMNSPLSMPIWGECIEDLRDYDIAMSRKSTEVEDSKHITIIPEQAAMYARTRGIKLPRFMKSMQTGMGIADGGVTEHTATMLTSQRIEDINSILSTISMKCGFDPGFFVFNGQTGIATATQIEADQQATIRTIKNLRDTLRESIIQLLYACNVFVDIGEEYVPVEEWTTSYSAMKEALSDAFNFGDITYNYEEDKQSWWKYRTQGDMPAWMYYVKFEGMTEDEAKELIAEATPEQPLLFGDYRE